MLFDFHTKPCESSSFTLPGVSPVSDLALVVLNLTKRVNHLRTFTKLSPNFKNVCVWWHPNIFAQFTKYLESRYHSCQSNNILFFYGTMNPSRNLSRGCGVYIYFSFLQCFTSKPPNLPCLVYIGPRLKLTNHTFHKSNSPKTGKESIE